MAPPLPKLTRVDVGGVDVTSYLLAWAVEQKMDENVRVASLGFKNGILDALELKEREITGKEVTIRRGVLSATEEYVFRGFVRSSEFQAGRFRVKCEDKLSMAKYKVVTADFDYNTDSEAGVVSEIFKSLVNEYTTVTANDTGVRDSGTTNIIRRLVVRKRKLIDVLLELAYALDWQFYYRPDTDLVYFEPKGYSTSSLNLDTGGAGQNIVKAPKWDITQDQLVNKVEVKGAPQLVETEEGPFLLDGSEDGWTTTSIVLDRKPVSIRILADTSNPPATERKAGKEGSSSDYEYTIDEEKGIVTWNTGVYAPTTSHYAFVQYTYNVPVQVTRRRQSSIDAYTDGEAREESFFRDDIKTVADAERFAEKYLDSYSEPFFKTALAVRTTTLLQPGIVHQVNDRINNIEREMLIKSLRTTWPYRYDELEVSDREYRTADWAVDPRQRLKRLEEKQSDNEELLTTVIDVTRDIRYKRRSMEVYRIDRSSDGVNVFILDDPVFGRLGTQKLGTGSTTETLVYRHPGGNVFEEYVFDTDYRDAGNTTATWDDTGNELSFAGGQSGQVAQTIAIAYGTTFAKYRVDLGTVSGNFTAQITANGGSNWEAVSLGTTSTFSNSGTDVRLKITCDASGGSIAPITDATGSYEAPAIKLSLEE